MNAVLREATLADIPGMHRVRVAVRENRLAPTTHITATDYADMLTAHGRGWVVDAEGTIAGFAVGDARDGNIWALFVHPDYEAQGHGRRLHDAMIAWLRTQGLPLLWLTTSAGTRAETFYRKAGWQDCGLTARGELRFELSGKTRNPHAL